MPGFYSSIHFLFQKKADGLNKGKRKRSVSKSDRRQSVYMCRRFKESFPIFILFFIFFKLGKQTTHQQNCHKHSKKRRLFMGFGEFQRLLVREDLVVFTLSFIFTPYHTLKSLLCMNSNKIEAIK